MLYNKPKEETISSIIWSVTDALRPHITARDETLYGVACLELLRADLEVEDPYDKVLNQAIEQGLVQEPAITFLKDCLSKTDFKDEWIKELSQEDVRTYVAYAEAGNAVQSGFASTPNFLSQLAFEILDINTGDTVADYGCGQGFFLTYAALKNNEASYMGFELTAVNTAIAMLRSYALGQAKLIEIRQSDIFDIPPRGESFTKIFSNYPLGMKVSSFVNQNPWFSKIVGGKHRYGRPVITDWIYNLAVIESLDEGGRAVVITSNGALSNSSDSKIRQYFVDEGYVECVIALPKNLLPGTGISCNILVLSKGNSRVKFIDATDIGTSTRRKNTLSDNDIDYIVGLVKDDSWKANIEDSPVGLDMTEVQLDERCTVEPLFTIGELDYKLLPRFYNGDNPVFDNPAFLGTYITSINRGVTLTANELDELSVSYDTNIRYITPKDIDNGLLNDQLPCLAALTPKLSKHVLRNGDLLIGRIGKPYSIAVADVPEGETYIPSSNVFVVRLNEEEVDPYYVAAFLNSETGEESLDRVVAGSNIASLSAQAIKEVTIPGRLIWETEDLVERYKQKLDELRLTKKRLEQIRQALRDFYEL